MRVFIQFIVLIFNACKKTLCQIRKCQVRGLRSRKKRSLLFVNEHFSDKHNEEIGVFLLILYSVLNCHVSYGQQQICLDLKGGIGSNTLKFEGSVHDLQITSNLLNQNLLAAGLQYKIGKYFGIGFYAFDQNYKWKFTDNQTISMNNGDYVKMQAESTVQVHGFSANIAFSIPLKDNERIHWLIVSGYQFGNTKPNSSATEFVYQEPEISIKQQNIEAQYSSVFLESGMGFSLSKRLNFNIIMGYNYSLYPVYECNYSIQTNNFSGNTVISSNGSGTYIGSSLSYAFLQFKKREKKNKHKIIPEVNDKNEVTAINGRTVISTHEMTVKTSSIEIQVWDYGKEDGDKISLFMDESQLLKKYKLTSKRKKIPVSLKPGQNKLIVFAHNLGKAPPNTASVIIFDGTNKKLLSLESSLGECGSIVIYYEPEK